MADFSTALEMTKGTLRRIHAQCFARCLHEEIPGRAGDYNIMTGDHEGSG